VITSSCEASKQNPPSGACRTALARLRARLLARKYRISTTTLRDRVLERNKGKRLWPKGPRAKR